MSAKVDVGALLPAPVDHVSHRGGETLSLMNEVGLTLPQVLFLTRLRQAGGSTASELAETPQHVAAGDQSVGRSSVQAGLADPHRGRG